MNLLKNTDSISKYKCEIRLSETKREHLNVCKIECSGKHNWSHLFYSVYAGYAMLLEKQLMDLPGKNFLIHQINEHSRGGHCEYETQLLDLEGNVLNQFKSRYHSQFLLDGKYLWFLKSGKKPYAIGSDRDLDLVKLNIKTAKVKQTIKLNYQHLLKCAYTTILRVEIIAKHYNGALQIKYTDKTGNLCSKQIHLKNI